MNTHTAGTTGTSGAEPLDSFDTALLAQLQQRVLQGDVAPARRSGRRRGVIAVGGIAATAAVALGLSTLGSPAAYAVENDADGDITITIHRLDDADGLERELAKHGITAEVNYKPLQITTGPDGLITMEHDSPAGEPPAGGATGDEGPTLSTGGSAQLSGPGEAGTSVEDAPPAATEESPCGDLAHSVSTATVGDDYVITIPKDSVLHDGDAALQITTTSDETESVAGIGVHYSVDGVGCGVFTIQDGASR